jgi:hypothetical protein
VPRVFIVNTFANASHSFVNPLYADSTFELIPIPESKSGKGKWIARYRDLRCFNSNQPLTKLISRKYHTRFVHNDPDLVNMTYGDGMNPRSGLLEKLAEGDWVAFYALLTPYRDNAAVKKDRDFYIVAAFQVKHIIRKLPDLQGSAQVRRKFIFKTYGRKLCRRILENAHTRRWLVSPKLNDKMRMIVVGSRRSRRFIKPIHLSRALCKAYFRDKNGKPWKWDKSKSELQTIGSYLRSIRMAETPSGLISLFLDRERVRRPRLYSYIVAHDGGFVPCATPKLLTLACCKPKIRRVAREGDWVMGTTPKKRGAGKLVFLARVTKKLTFEEYYDRVPRARRDNIYRLRSPGRYTQVKTEDHGPHNKKRDLSADAVLLSEEFVYYGGSAISIPESYADPIAITQGHRTIKNSDDISHFVEWAREKPWGVQGKPEDGKAC